MVNIGSVILLRIILIGLLVFQLCNGRVPFRIVVNKLEYTYNEEYIDMNLTLHNHSTPSVDFFVKVLKPLNTVKMDIDLSLYTSQTGNFNLINMTVDACKLETYRKMSGLVGYAFEMLDQHGNFTHVKCPMETVFLTAVNFSISENIFPSYTPEAQFTLKLILAGLPNKSKKWISTSNVTLQGRFHRWRKSIFQ